MYTPTIEDTYNFSIETDRHTKERIRIFDLGGNQLNIPQNMCNIEKHYITAVDSIILLHDLSNPDSFKTIEIIKREV